MSDADLFGNGIRFVPRARIADDGLGAEAVEHLADLRNGKERVDWRDLRAHAHDRHQRDVHLNGVGHHDDDGPGF